MLYVPDVVLHVAIAPETVVTQEKTPKDPL